MVAAGIVLRTLVWWPSHNLFGVLEYDDGVYYATARLLLNGYLPYRDFTIVHPPGVSIALLPAAGLGHVFGDPFGMVAGRVQMQVIAALNIVLVYRLAGRLPGDPATRGRRALVAAALYAVMPNAIVAEQTILLDPSPPARACSRCGFSCAATHPHGWTSSRAAFSSSPASR